MRAWKSLQVESLDRADQYRDMVRVNYHSRGRVVKEGQIYLLTRRSTKGILVCVRGHEMPDVILIDAQTRRKLNIDKGKIYDFNFRKVGAIGQLIWTYNASEPNIRIAAQMGIVSLTMGLISLLPLIFGGFKMLQDHDIFYIIYRRSYSIINEAISIIEKAMGFQ